MPCITQGILLIDMPFFFSSGWYIVLNIKIYDRRQSNMQALKASYNITLVFQDHTI